MPEYNAIPTKYNGVQYRSRLEARWALFFDILRIEYYYEYEGFQLPSGRYVPDFFLPKHGWFEIKPVEPNEIEKKLAIEMRILLADDKINNDEPRRRFYILVGFPLLMVYDTNDFNRNKNGHVYKGNFWLENHGTQEVYFSLNLFNSRNQDQNNFYNSDTFVNGYKCCIHCYYPCGNCSLYTESKSINMNDAISEVEAILECKDQYHLMDRVNRGLLEKITKSDLLREDDIHEDSIEYINELLNIYNQLRKEHELVRDNCIYRRSKRINDAYECATKHRFY